MVRIYVLELRLEKLAAHICVVLLLSLSFFAEAQKHIGLGNKGKMKSDSLEIFHKSDSLLQKFTLDSQLGVSRTDTINVIGMPLDTAVENKILVLKGSLQQRIDSLREKGNASLDLQQKLDSLNLNTGRPNEKYQELLTLEKKIKDQLKTKLPTLDTLSSVKNIVNEKINGVQSVNTELGIGPLGEELKPNIKNTSIPNSNIPGLPSNISNQISIRGVDKPEGFGPQLPGEKIPSNELSIPSQVNDFKKEAGNLNKIADQADEIAKNENDYAREVKEIKAEGLDKSEKLPELAEQQASQLGEVQELKTQEAASTKQLEEYKKLIEQYKEEKKIYEELKEKAKELATEQITQNQGKVDEVMKKMAKYKRKFSQVHDMRNLPKRAPNPMKNVSWRERVVPGLTFQSLSSTSTWLEFDPQVYYKLNRNLLAGIGGMYRFSMNPSKITFDDFGSMWGTKVFAQYHVFKGFFVRGEVQYVTWKPWDLKLTDPNYIDRTFVAAAGIGKRYQIAKKIKGNMQTLYHFHWEGTDPYKPKVMIRIGIDFSLKKREEKHWEKKLKEIKKQQ